MSKTCLFIFRRDLRLEDNNGLYFALQNYDKVIPIFIYNPVQVKENKNKYISKRCIQFMTNSLKLLDKQLKQYKSKLHIFYGNDVNILKKIVQKRNINSIVFNQDYTPFAIERDEKIIKLCLDFKIECIVKEDYLLSTIGTLNKSDGEPYTVFTPFKNNGLKHKVQKPNYYENLYNKFGKLNLKSSDFIDYDLDLIFKAGRKEGLTTLNNLKNLENYNTTRNNPNIQTSYLSVYIKFGNISIREVYWKIKDLYKFDNQLIDQLYWREFYYYIVYYFPKVLKGKNFNDKYDNIQWTHNKDYFEKWCSATTGYPIVDAGMQQLLQTGFMHNRLRLITSNFLNRMLNLDWRLGEKFFANELIDYDPTVNNGNWQWIASSGTDPKPYFQRLFNPMLQSKKFDPDATYIKKWLPQLKDIHPKELHNWEDYYKNYDLQKINYFKPIVDYKKARQLSIDTFRKVL